MEMNFFCKIYYNLFLNKIDLNKLKKEQKEITIINIKKHLNIFILMTLIMPYCYFIITNYYIDKIDIVISSLLGVLLISGTAWFAITFGAIPIIFCDFAIKTTAHLFASFAFSMAAVFVAASIAVPFLSPILFLCFFTLYSASVKYDIVDALKLGIDEAIYKQAKVGRIYFVGELKKKKNTGGTCDK